MAALRDLVVSIDFDDIDISNLTRVDTAMDEIEDALGDMGRNIDDAAGEFKQMGDNAGTSMAGIRDDADDAGDAIDEMRLDSEKAGDALDDINQGDPLDDIKKDADDAGDAIDDLKKDSDKAEDALDELGDTGKDAMDDVEDGAKNAADKTDKLENELGQAERAGDGLGGSFKKLIKIAAGFVAFDKIKDLGVSFVEAAATVAATEAQFEQVFDGMESKSEKALNAIADETQILPNRLKGSFIQMAAFAKTAGADTEQALGISERATLAAADSAAFYDRSIEDVTESLQSFLKGNYENDAALGISATETTRNAAAMELFGEKFNDLSEIQKQETLLKMVEDGNELSGALGQAAREGDGFENVIGNVKGAWDEMKATLGDALLDTVIDGLQGLTTAMQNFDPQPVVSFLEGVVTFGQGAWDVLVAIKDTIVAIVTDTGDISQIWEELGVPPELAEQIEMLADIFGVVLNGAIDLVKAGFYDLKDIFNWIVENIDIVSAGITGLGTALGTMRIVSMISSGYNLLKNALLLSTPVTIAQTIATQGLNAAMRANPIGFVVTLIGLLVAAGVLLYQNWDTIKEKAYDLWESIKDAWGSLKSWAGDVFEGMKDNVLNAVAKLEEGWATAWTNIKLAAEGAVNGVIGQINSLIETINKIPGVNIPLVAEVSFVEKGKDGSHATGLSRVPFDGYRAELHKDEAVLTAKQSNALRAAGILDSKGSKPKVDIDGGSGDIGGRGGGNMTFAPTVNIEVNGADGDEETIAQRAAEAARKELERFWRRMLVTQG